MNFLIAALLSSLTPGFSAAYTAPITAPPATMTIAKIANSPLRHILAANIMARTAGASVSVVPRSGSARMRSIGTPAATPASKSPLNPSRCMKPPNCAMNMITQSLEISLGWKNHSHLLPP